MNHGSCYLVCSMIFNIYVLIQAYCEPGKVEGNGVLAFAQHVLFPILAGEGTVLHTELHD